MYDEPPNSQPKFRWVTSEWHFANPTPEMKKWNEKYRSSLEECRGRCYDHHFISAMAEMARTLARNSKSRNVKDYIEELIFAQYQQSRR